MCGNFNLRETLSQGLHERAGGRYRRLSLLPSLKAYGAWQGRKTVNMARLAWLVALR
jgi:hypothetical protein